MENLSILLVEDHRQLAQSVLEFLEQEGAMVDYASDTTLARSLVQEHHYDILILDVMLPGEDGYTFCQALRKDMAKSMPVIFMTARDQLDDKLEGFARAVTTTSSNPSPCRNWWPGCAPWCAVSVARWPPTCSPWPTWNWIRPVRKCAAMANCSSFLPPRFEFYEF
ncbi:putative transcriptional regulatory protein YedW [Alcanivorax sp. ALC70]|nr:putative transcriptional regulatory protein YedW [Alcanivorax sp. ALC70]